MESRLVRGLYFCGEVIDIDGARVMRPHIHAAHYFQARRIDRRQQLISGA